ncbi:cytochrome ubiquinol oxidase subunit I, partial [Streptomyces sp. NPDC048279]
MDRGPGHQAHRLLRRCGPATTRTILSAYFILAANSWMQHPVGYKIDKA